MTGIHIAVHRTSARRPLAIHRRRQASCVPQPSPPNGEAPAQRELPGARPTLTHLRTDMPERNHLDEAKARAAAAAAWLQTGQLDQAALHHVAKLLDDASYWARRAAEEA